MSDEYAQPLLVHRLELATIDRDARCRKQTDLPAELDEACAHLANGMTAALPEVRNRLVIGDQAAQERGLAHRRLVLEANAGLAHHRASLARFKQTA
jgi:hypothetical protein